MIANGEAHFLYGRKVAFTGELASMTRAQAAGLVQARGGKVVTGLSRPVDVLVVGQQAPPLRKNGRLTRRLEQARRLQQMGASVLVLTEADWLHRLGLPGPLDGARKLFLGPELAAIIRAPVGRIRAWVRAGLLEPAKVQDGVALFDFAEVSSARRIWELIRAGVTPARVRRSLRRLRNCLEQARASAGDLAVEEVNGQFLLRGEDGSLCDAAGQRYFDFVEDTEATVRVVHPEPTAAEWFERGSHCEEEGHLVEAEQAYRQALQVGGPDAETCFNLGNVLFALDQKESAAERLKQAVEIEPGHVRGWNNLGNVLAELGRPKEAEAAYQAALKISPAYPDAHYNLADLLDGLGRRDQAQKHWQAYIRLEKWGPWAAYARQKLGKGNRKA